MKLRELAPKLGDRIKFTDNGSFLGGCEATIIAINPAIDPDDIQSYLIGWKTGERNPYGHLTRVAPSTRCEKLTSYDEYVASSWARIDLEVDLIVSATKPKSAGMQCSGRHCGTFVSYAEPNQPDGGFLCYSCRGRPACLR